jgi:uncharacterized protein
VFLGINQTAGKIGKIQITKHLTNISGLNKKAIDTIIENREKLGKIKSRKEIEKMKGITPKVFEQSIGFIRIIDGDNPLDKTSIHPERYKDVIKFLDSLGLTTHDIGTGKLQEKLSEVNVNNESEKLGIDKYTLKDIVDDLMKPNRDPRDNMPKPLLKSDVLHIEDLHIGDKLQGTVRNVVDFGVFIDIGVHNDGLAHISKLSNSYIKHPSDLFSVGDIVNCYVEEITKEKGKVRSEGKEYVMKDSDVVLFRFNV